MAADPSPFGDTARYDDAAVDAVLALSDGVQRTVGMARALVAGGRRVDLAGLDRSVGLLCAKALDLPPGRGREVRARLLALRVETDALTVALRETSPE